ncbi:uncharacterized protein zgc:152968 isoform X1 [Triplophysa dalaica]|uniref:uncharacterized protein zgc:152968 isoform X1 n=1 Tax=Triplophysa dalaica TaxID=1582913 RepID=UPI0024E004C4|nr:uncharacterized protein zgc:152968 isoform X1 [Triplophysa dalaica]
MFPSTLLFSGIVCPFLRWGRCKRPYCLYSHGEDKTSIVTTDLGEHNVSASNGASHTTEDNCLEELERINKEIEAVKSEVEKERKRLSQYQSSQSLTQTESAGDGSEKYLRNTDSPVKDQNGNHLRQTKPVAASTVDRKYVVDRARPRTDLEYDPCSNFSADLLSGSTVDCKLKSTSKVHNNGTERNVPLFHLDDSDEGTLVIDIPLSKKLQGRHRPKPKKKTVIEPQHSPVGKVRAENKKLCSKGSPIHNTDVQEKEGALIHPLTVTQEQESSEGELIIDVSPLEDEQKLSNQHGTVAKDVLESPILSSITDSPAEEGKETKEGPTNKQITNVKHLKKQTTEEPATEPIAELNASPQSNNLNMETLDMQGEEKSQNIENVLDDISTCLDNLRSESEKIKSIQDVTMLPVCYLPQDKFISATGHCNFGTKPQINNISEYSPKSISIKKISQDQGSLFEPYFNMVSSQTFASSLHKDEEHTCNPSSQNLVETPCPNDQESSKSEPFIHTIPSVSGIDDRIVLSEPSTSHLNPGTTVEYDDKISTSDATFVPGEATVSSQGLASAAIEGANNEIIEIASSSESELRYSDLDLSETDPMEECYRIFMEANQLEAAVVQNKAPVVQIEAPMMLSDVPNDLLVTPETGMKSNPPPLLKKRVAHAVKFEQANKSKGQIIVPLRDGVSQLVIPNRAQACQRRAAVLTAAVKGCQTQVMSNPPKKVYMHSVIHSNVVQNHGLPVGATLQLGANLQLIVPEGNCGLPLMLIPTAMSVQRLPQTSPPTQLPQTSHPPQTSHHPQPPNYTPAKSMGVKRKAKIRHEVGTKVPHDVRQRYVNLFVEEFLKTSVTVQDAFEKALVEEKSVYDRSINKLKYLSVAVNALKRLKNQSVLPAKASSERDQNVSRGKVPLNTQALQGPDDWTLYKQLKEHVLSEEMLRVNNYPRKHPDKADFAIQYGDLKKGINDPLKRICCRCGATFSVDRSGKHTRREECNYHYGKVIENRVPGGVETRYSCCESVVGSPGCQVFNLHVHDAVSLQGFVSSLPQSPVGKTCPGVFAVDTETCYTTEGLEVVRVTLVNSSLQVVFDTFVKPDNDVTDYNTRFSGISKDDVTGTSSSLHDVQKVLLNFIKADTFLIGHGLENDLAALKIIHSSVIDTSMVFPHRLGPPHKRELNSLTGDYLRRIIQESVEGHDTREDAMACMELMLWRVKEDSKVKRW